MNVTQRRPSKRSRSSMRTAPVSRRIPRTLRYNGENKITRSVSASIPFQQTGWALGAAFFQGMNIVFEPGTVTFYGSATNFSSYNIPNASEITALYDQIRIDKVELTFSSGALGTVNASVGINNPAPKFLVCNDVNDGIGAASLAEIQQAPNKSFYAIDGRDHKWSVRPKFQRVIYQTALVSNYEPATGFVNSNSTIPHYGVKMAITNLDNLNSAVTGRVDFDVKLYFTLRNVR